MHSQSSDQGQSIQSFCKKSQIQTFECAEDIEDMNDQGKSCQCLYNCQNHQKSKDAIKKKMKKKQQKKKKKAKQLQQHHDAHLRQIQQIIKDIYSLKEDFRSSKIRAQKCFSIQINRDKYFKLMCQVISQQIQKIGKQLTRYMIFYPQRKDSGKRQFTRNVYTQIIIIQSISQQIQKLVNLFLKIYFSEEDRKKLQHNFIDKTFRYLLEHYLQKQSSFIEIRQRVLNDQQNHPSQRQLIKILTSAHNSQVLEEISYCSYTDSSSDYSQQSQQELANKTDPQMTEKESKNKRRRLKKRKQQNQHENTFDSIMLRLQKISFMEQQRKSCNVDQKWIQKLKTIRNNITLQNFNDK